jgi:hypothetical protein
MRRPRKLTLQRDPPKRTLAKSTAIRHLIHASIRMTMQQEDPFAIHLLIHSADQTLIDYAKATNKPLSVDWRNQVKEELQSEFFAIMREGANFMKHGQTDAGADLYADNIVQRNVLTLFITVTNYGAVFGRFTDHMLMFIGFMHLLVPHTFRITTAEVPEDVARGDVPVSITPAQFFESFGLAMKAVLPMYEQERIEDLQDNPPFFDTPISELQKRKRDAPQPRVSAPS